MSERSYEGPVVFADDGVHYPVGEDGHADTSRPLRWVGGGVYRDAEDGEPSHFDAHHLQHVDLDFGEGEAIELEPGEADAVRDFLAQHRAEGGDS